MAFVSCAMMRRKIIGTGKHDAYDASLVFTRDARARERSNADHVSYASCCGSERRERAATRKSLSGERMVTATCGAKAAQPVQIGYT